MGNRLLKIDSPHSLEKALAALHSAFAGGGGFYVSIFWADDDRVRSLAQNRTYWQTLTTISQHTGISKDTLHTDFKRRFLAKILARDDKAFRACFDSIKATKAHLSDAEYECLAMGVAGLVSTTKASVAQMDEYLTDIKHWYLNTFDRTLNERL